MEKEIVKEKILENRKEIYYFLSYGLKQDLTEKEIKYFEKIFIALYENKLLENLGITEEDLK